MLYFAQDKDNVIVDVPYLEIYIPDFYFEKEIAQLIGDRFRYFGVVNFRGYKDSDGKTAAGPVETLKLPTYIVSYPSGGYEEKSLDLIGKGEEKYYIAKFYKTDVLCANNIDATTLAFRAFLEILMAGKLPGTLKYSSIIDIWNKNFKMANVNFDIAELIKEIIITELYRDEKDISTKFSKVIGKNPRVSEYAYKTVSPREVTRLTSTYAGITFEAFDDMMISGINNLKYNRKEVESPMQEVLKY